MLALKSVLPRLPMAAGLSANHLAALELSPPLHRLYVARDNDAAGRHAAEGLRERAAGIEVRELVPRCTPTSTSTSAASAPTGCVHGSRNSYSRPTAPAS
jgi:hypothetical protein